ncbi:MAG: hypothetical protein IJR93_10815 [Treponema sp.]|nr:hypothetical protein [Treponema sp.]
MYSYDILVSLRFLSKENGGRLHLPMIKDFEYTYRPVFRLEGETMGYCCGVVIGDYIKNYHFERELYDIRVLFLSFQKVKDKLSVGKRFKLYEGNHIIGVGQILKRRE